MEKGIKIWIVLDNYTSWKQGCHRHHYLTQSVGKKYMQFSAACGTSLQILLKEWYKKSPLMNCSKRHWPRDSLASFGPLVHPYNSDIRERSIFTKMMFWRENLNFQQSLQIDSLLKNIYIMVQMQDSESSSSESLASLHSKQERW